MRTSFPIKAPAALAAAFLPLFSFAADAVGTTEQQPTNWNAIVMFLIFNGEFDDLTKQLIDGAK